VPAYGSATEAWEPYALSVLNGVLSGGNSARFPRELVRGTAIASSIAAGYSPAARHPGLFVISANPVQGRTVRELEAAVLAQLRRLQAEPVSDDELTRVKAQVAASDVFQRDSVFYQAMKMGTLETVGLDWRLTNDYVMRVRAVTPAQVQAVAQKYFADRNMTVTVLEPQPDKLKPRRPAPAGGAHGR
jgi:zinc protease